MVETQNLFANLGGDARNETVAILAQSCGARVERIVSTGQRSPAGFWYDQSEHEWVAVLSGEGELEFADGRTIVMKPGDFVWIPAGCKHRVVGTSSDEPTVWLAVFLPVA